MVETIILGLFEKMGSKYITEYDGLFCSVDKELRNQNTCKQDINAKDILRDNTLQRKKRKNTSVSCKEDLSSESRV